MSRRSPTVSRYYIKTSATKRRLALVRRAFAEFLALPMAIFIGAIGLAFITLSLDRADAPIRQILLDHIFRSEQNTHDFLATLLTGLITLISITFSILLLAVQQTASSLSNQVYDQFLRRTANQIFLGYAVGLTVYTLIILASVGKGFNPILSAGIIVAFSVMGLALLIVLIYGTIYQMRPVVIVEAMRDHILLARVRHRRIVYHTLERSHSAEQVRAEIRAGSSGFLQDVRIDALADILDSISNMEIEILHPIGTYLAQGDIVAAIRAPSSEAAAKIAPQLIQALILESDREITQDPAWGVIELESIGWTTVSSAKSTPEPPRLVINALRDIFTRWTNEECGHCQLKERKLPIVYPDDVRAHVLNGLATIAAGANESLQHVVMIEALRAMKSLYEHVPRSVRPDVKDVIRRTVPALKPLILTKELEDAIRALLRSLTEGGDEFAAAELETAVEELAKSVGRVAKGPA